MLPIDNKLTVAKILSISDINREGLMTARLIDQDAESKGISLYYTSPSYSPPDGKQKGNFTGLTSFPGKGAFVIVYWSKEDKKWYYMATICGASNVSSPGSAPTLTGSKSAGKYSNVLPTMNSDLPEEGIYSHGTEPQKHTLESPLGGKFQISDSANEDDLQYFTKMQSFTEKRVIADDVRDYIGLVTEHGDGLKSTGVKYNEKGVPGPGPGPRGVQLRAHRNVMIESDSGSLDADVLGGYQLNIKNRSVNVPFTRPFPLDSKVGEVNVESYSNSINIRAYGREYPTGGAMPVGKGIFIDASDYQGVVQIKAGKGGVEIFSNGDIDFNCAGNFNVNAVGAINLKAGSTNAANFWTSQNALPTNAATPPYPINQGIPEPPFVHLNPPTDPGWKLQPTLNNDMQWPLN